MNIDNNYENINNIKISNTVKTIGKYSFYKLTNLTKIPLGNSISRIDEFAFSENKNMRDITLPKSLIEIGSNVFYNCSSTLNIDFERINKCFTCDNRNINLCSYNYKINVTEFDNKYNNNKSIYNKKDLTKYSLFRLLLFVIDVLKNGFKL